MGDVQNSKRNRTLILRSIHAAPSRRLSFAFLRSPSGLRTTLYSSPELFNALYDVGNAAPVDNAMDRPRSEETNASVIQTSNEGDR